MDYATLVKKGIFDLEKKKLSGETSSPQRKRFRFDPRPKPSVRQRPVGDPFPVPPRPDSYSASIRSWTVKKFFKLHNARAEGEYSWLFDLLRNLTAKITKSRRQNNVGTTTRLNRGENPRFINRIPYALYDAPNVKISNRELKERCGRTKFDDRERKKESRNYDHELGDYRPTLKETLLAL